MSHDTCGRDADERRNREAARWLMRLQRPNLSPQKLLQFSRWQDSPENRAAFDALDPIWRAIQPPRERIEPVSQQRTQPAKPVESELQRSSYRCSERVRLVSEEAAYWYFVSVDDPKVLRSDSRDFLAWTRRSPENVAELFRIAQLDGKLRRLKLVLRSLGVTNVIELTSSGTPHRLHRELQQASGIERILLLKLAAAALFFGVAMVFVVQEYMRSDRIITTGANQWQYMTLSDGTTVHIDARSRVEVEYSDAARVVRVREGSAVFDVAKDFKRPFIARTSLVDVVAVGTRFGVSLDPGVTTTVSEGTVKVTSHDHVNHRTVTLQAGEELRVSDSSLASPQVARVDAERKLQWASGLLLLDGMTIAEGVEQLNRRNRTQIVVESPTLSAKVIEFASIKVDEPERYARMIAADPDVTMIFDKENDVIRLSE